jgi:hypothetical protein
MGQITPNISIYIPAAGETNYDASFAAGMVNIDQHDHSGGPNKGIPIATSGIADGSITYQKLNVNVVDGTTGLGTSGVNLNQIVLKDPLKAIYVLSPATGFISMDGSSAHVRTMTSGNTNRMTIANPAGVAADPIFSVNAIPDLDGVNNGAGSFLLQVGGVSQATLTSGLLSLATNNIALSNGKIPTTGGIGAGGTAVVTGFIVAPGQMYLCLLADENGGTGHSNICIASAGSTLGNDGTQNMLGGTNPTISMNGGTGQISITNNAAGSLAFQISWIRLL